MVDKSKRSIVGLVLIFLIVIGDLIVGFADSPSKPNTFTKAVADGLYCAIASPNCVQFYCENDATIQGNNGFIDPCQGVWCPTSPSQGNYGETACTTTTPVGFCYMQMTKTNISTFTSSAFTNIVSSSTWTCPTGIIRNTASEKVYCTASFDYDTGVAATVAVFRFHTTGSVNSAAPLQIGPSAALNSNETMAIQSIFQGSGTLSLQVSVTGVAGTINIGPGEADCLWSIAQASGNVG